MVLSRLVADVRKRDILPGYRQGWKAHQGWRVVTRVKFVVSENPHGYLNDRLIFELVSI